MDDLDIGGHTGGNLFMFDGGAGSSSNRVGKKSGVPKIFVSALEMYENQTSSKGNKKSTHQSKQEKMK